MTSIYRIGFFCPSLISAFACLTVFAAYYIKGLSGFGTAAVLVPIFTLLYDPATAIITTTFLDMVAGAFLLISVYRRLDWKFVIPILLVFFPGAYLGVHFMKSIPKDLLTHILGGSLIVFISLLLLDKIIQFPATMTNRIAQLCLPVAFIAGVGGGLLGISGPLLVGYLKLIHEKTYFRDQVVGILAFGAFWRFFLYRSNSLTMNIETSGVVFIIIFMSVAVWVGSRHYLRVKETAFNRIVALVLIIPTIKLFW